MQYKSIPLAVLFLLTIAPLISALNITNFTITATGGYTNDITPSMTIVIDGNVGDTNMQFSCGTIFANPVPYVSDYNGFNITQDGGCPSTDGNRTITVRVTDTSGSDDENFNLALDRAGPTISNQTPSQGTRTTNQRPLIGFSFSDANGIGISSENRFSLLVNGIAIPVGPNPGQLNVNLVDKNARYTPQTDLNEGQVNIQVDANDDLLNPSRVTWPFFVDLNAHLTSISINGGALYARSRDTNMSAQGDSDLNACHFKMDGGTYGDWIPFSASMPFQLSDSDGNKTVWGQCKDALEHLTEERSYIILLDTAPPSGVSGTLSIPNIQTNQVTLHWGEITDSGSRLKEYEIKKDGAIVTTISNVSIHDYNVTGLNPGTAYTFRLTARDNALNEASDEEGTTTRQGGGGNPPGGGSDDTVAPTISWLKPDANATVSGIVKLRVQFSDNVSVTIVRLYVDSTNTANLLGTFPTAETSATEMDWNSGTVALGVHELFAVAMDSSGNSKQASRTVRVVKAQTDQNQGNSTGAEKALEGAKNRQQMTRQELDIARLVLSNYAELEPTYLEGVRLLKEAQRALAEGRFSDSTAKSEAAVAQFDRFESETRLSWQSDVLLGETASLDYKGIFSKSKLNPGLAVFAEEIQNQMETERRLVVFKHTLEDGKNVFFVRVNLKIKNNTGSQNDFVVVELVPKALAQSSDELVGTPEFVVLEKDPLLEWKLDRFGNGEEVTVSYTINKTFSEEEIQQLLDSPELNSFKIAPLIVKASAVQNTPIMLVPTSLLGLEFLANPTVLAVIIGILVILAFAFLVWQKNKAPRWSGRNAW